MQIIAFNGSPRKKGNTSTLIEAVLEGAQSAGAETIHVRLHDLNMKGCQACYACKENHGVCALKDDLSPYLHKIKDSAGIVFGCPIYMYRISGQMKIWVDRMYSYYAPRTDGESGYSSAIPPGKTFAMVISQGAPDPEQYHRSIRYLAGMAGYGMKEAGRIVHAGGSMGEAKDNPALLDKAREIGRKMGMSS
jgi:multimeric flavodoxin WrbA